MNVQNDGGGAAAYAASWNRQTTDSRVNMLARIADSAGSKNTALETSTAIRYISPMGKQNYSISADLVSPSEMERLKGDDLGVFKAATARITSDEAFVAKSMTRNDARSVRDVYLNLVERGMEKQLAEITPQDHIAAIDAIHRHAELKLAGTTISDGDRELETLLLQLTSPTKGVEDAQDNQIEARTPAERLKSFADFQADVLSAIGNNERGDLQKSLQLGAKRWREVERAADTMKF